MGHDYVFRRSKERPLRAALRSAAKAHTALRKRESRPDAFSFGLGSRRPPVEESPALPAEMGVAESRFVFQAVPESPIETDMGKADQRGHFELGQAERERCGA